ncbi:MAG: heavy metal translocating P-type ATPase [Burkholderiaceae bacterium]
MNAPALPCFHCGELAPTARWNTRIDGAERRFCCAGCAAIASAIDAAGLSDYYRTRTAKAPRAGAQAPLIPAEFFDRPECRVALESLPGGDESARLALDGVRCPACLWLIGEQLRRIPGVAAVEVDYASHTARLIWPPGQASLGTAVNTVTALGYRARPCAAGHRATVDDQARRRDSSRLIFAAVAGTAVMNAAAALYLAGTAGHSELWEIILRWLSAAICLPLLAYSGADFFVAAWRDLKHRRLGMDVPLALGLIAAWLGSLPGLLAGGPVYFDSIAMLVLVVLAARWFETRARLKAAAQLDRLAVLEPLLARRANSPGERVPALDLKPGEIIRIHAGETVPADGEITAGTTAVNEALLTGEPHPLMRGPGDSLRAGSINLDQAVSLKLSRTGAASTLGQLNALLERGLASRPPVAELADRLASPLVGVILVAAGLTYLAWLAINPAQALPAAIAVLIVTCPCALALATPLTLALAAARLAGAGVIALRIGAIDALARARTVVFDKTGTLTLGQPMLAAVTTWGGLDRDNAISTAAALEAESSHPLAQAIRSAQGPTPPRPAESIDLAPGLGVAGQVEGRHWRLGAPDFVAPAAPLPAAAGAAIAAARSAGRMVVAMSDATGRGAVFEFDDVPRSGLAELGPALRTLGLTQQVCLSGDHGRAVKDVAAIAQLDQALGGQSPATKLAWVQARQTTGEPVVMVGDGLNDAATLAAAEASISFAQAPQLAQFSADFLIAGDNLAAIARARRIAQQARAILHQNLGWAAAYNLFAIPLAALGEITPWLAALGMATSSALVVANSLRLTEPTNAGIRPRPPQ